MKDHKCPTDPFREMFDQTITEDGESWQAGCWDLECAPHVEFYWDQWMVCHIRCYHGCANGVACGINFNESFSRAVEQFNAYDHTQPCREQLPDESLSDYCERANRGPYNVPAVVAVEGPTE